MSSKLDYIIYERAMGVEPTAFSLGRRHSTGELRPLEICYTSYYFLNLKSIRAPDDIFLFFITAYQVQSVNQGVEQDGTENETVGL